MNLILIHIKLNSVTNKSIAEFHRLMKTLYCIEVVIPEMQKKEKAG